MFCGLRFPDKGKPVARLGRKAKGRAGVSGGAAWLPKGQTCFSTVASHSLKTGEERRFVCKSFQTRLHGGKRSAESRP